jgi:hypothetical protein
MPINQRQRKHVDQQSISLPGELSRDDNRIRIAQSRHNKLDVVRGHEMFLIHHTCGRDEALLITMSPVKSPIMASWI